MATPEAKTVSLIERLRSSVIATKVGGWYADGRKRTKWQTMYRQQPKVSATCEKCAWFIPGQVGSCKLVDEADQPDAGMISPSATCNLWNAGPARIYMEDKLRGRGAGVKGIAPGNLRARAEQLLVKGEATVAPPDVQDRMFLKGKALSAIKEAAPSMMQEVKDEPPPPVPRDSPKQEGKHDKTALLRMV